MWVWIFFQFDFSIFLLFLNHKWNFWKKYFFKSLLLCHKLYEIFKKNFKSMFRTSVLIESTFSTRWICKWNKIFFSYLHFQNFEIWRLKAVCCKTKNENELQQKRLLKKTKANRFHRVQLLFSKRTIVCSKFVPDN